MAPVFMFLVLTVCILEADAESLWPQPKSVIYDYGQCVGISAGKFAFSITGADSTILQSALLRYAVLAFPNVVSVSPASCLSPGNDLPLLQINVTNPAQDLNLNTSEAYSLIIPRQADGVTGILTADTVYGALRGLETFAQLVDWRPDLKTWVVPVSVIQDSPAFQHRGALVDTSRHFLPLPSLYAFIDGLAYDKFNVLHWHIVDDQSFPWVSASLPSLSALGAWGAPDPSAVASHTYSPADVQAVIQYARARGVRVLPEFDTPGHSQSWGAGYPGLLTQCYNASGPIEGSYGPIDPTQAKTWTFLRALFTEVATVFPDQYIHVGGDEVSYTCWASNPNIAAWMAQNGLSPGDYEGLESYYVQKVLDIVAELGKSYVGWQEIFDNGLKLAADTVVGVWKYHNTGSSQGEGALTWEGELFNVTQSGFRAVVSSPWYLNYIAYGEDWPQYWTADLLAFNGTPEQEALVMGGEMAMWGEYVDSTNVISRNWPRGSAVGEALWSRPGANGNLTDAQSRMNAHKCRLMNRGLPAEPPNGPAFCPQEWQPVYSPPWARVRIDL